MEHANSRNSRSVGTKGKEEQKKAAEEQLESGNFKSLYTKIRDKQICYRFYLDS